MLIARRFQAFFHTKLNFLCGFSMGLQSFNAKLKKKTFRKQKRKSTTHPYKYQFDRAMVLIHIPVAVHKFQKSHSDHHMLRQVFLHKLCNICRKKNNNKVKRTNKALQKIIYGHNFSYIILVSYEKTKKV